MWSVLVFAVIPLSGAILAITSAMMLVYHKVRQNALKSSKWKFGVGGASKLEQAVFWQCVFYTLAFYVTWPILFGVYLASVDVNGPLGLSITVAFLAPLQGFTNCMVYVRPKIFNAKLKRKVPSSTSQRSARRVTQITNIADTFEFGLSSLKKGASSIRSAFARGSSNGSLGSIDDSLGSSIHRRRRSTFWRLFGRRSSNKAAKMDPSALIAMLDDIDKQKLEELEDMPPDPDGEAGGQGGRNRRSVTRTRSGIDEIIHPDGRPQSLHSEEAKDDGAIMKDPDIENGNDYREESKEEIQGEMTNNDAIGIEGEIAKEISNDYSEAEVIVEKEPTPTHQKSDALEGSE